MSTINTNATTKPAKRPEGYTKAAWDTDTFRVFDGLIKLIEGHVTMPVFVNHPVVKDLMARCCGAKTPEDRYALTVSLLISMAKDRTHNGEKERHVNPISYLRSFFNGGYKLKAELPVTYTMPKAPKAPAKKTAVKAKSTKVVSIKDVPEEVKKAILAEYYKAQQAKKSA